MHGNVKQWCSDVYGDYEHRDNVENPKCAGASPEHVLRGGSWADNPISCRSASRDRGGPKAWAAGWGSGCAWIFKNLRRIVHSVTRVSFRPVRVENLRFATSRQSHSVSKVDHLDDSGHIVYFVMNQVCSFEDHLANRAADSIACIFVHGMTVKVAEASRAANSRSSHAKALSTESWAINNTCWRICCFTPSETCTFRRLTCSCPLTVEVYDRRSARNSLKNA